MFHYLSGIPWGQAVDEVCGVCHKFTAGLFQIIGVHPH